MITENQEAIDEQNPILQRLHAQDLRTSSTNSNPMKVLEIKSRTHPTSERTSLRSKYI